MRIWLITIGEPLPKLSDNARLWRTGMLAEELAGRDHEVTWWSSRVDHIRKAFFSDEQLSFELGPKYVLKLLDGSLYRRNVSFARLVNHLQIGLDFRRRAANEASPDIILSSFPSIELCAIAVAYARSRKIPVIMDVRDLWPDIFFDAVAWPVKWLAYPLLRAYASVARSAFARATAISAISPSYLQWGVNMAGRSVSAVDRVFPLAYRFTQSDFDVESDTLKFRKQYSIPTDSLICLFCGTLGRTYDLQPMLETAQSLLDESNHRWCFVICGDGERLEYWKRVAEANPLVKFTGWLNESDMRVALSAADVGLAAYASNAPQSIPNKVIEYMAAGLPVASSLQGETNDMLVEEACGMTYAVDDSLGLRGVLSAFESKEIRDEFSGNARRLFQQRFDANVVYAQFADYLEQMAVSDERLNESLVIEKG